MRESVGVGLDEVRECVEAGVRGDGGWDGMCKRGVDEGSVGYEMRADDAFLQLSGLVEEDGVGRNLAAGSGGGRNADEVTVTGGKQADAEGVFDALIVAPEGGEEFGEIERAASADADDAGGMGSAGACEGGVEGGDGGFACRCAVGGDGATGDE